MATYLIGDVQGCFDALQALLHHISFDPRKDRLGFVGDLVNRGDKSLETLAFISHVNDPLIVLGNHDLHLMALYFLGESKFHKISHTLQDVLASSHCKKYIDFLLSKPFVHQDAAFAMVHAGIPPQWSIDVAKKHSDDVSSLLQKTPEAFFMHIYGDAPLLWCDDLQGWERARYIVNAFTRMRFCDQKGVLDLQNKKDVSDDAHYQPWFSWRAYSNDAKDIYFGHWASLEGRCHQPHVFALDTGCAWGGRLTAMRVEDHQLFSVNNFLRSPS
jgi:bis(5'-nucleosyl)-tetraphosphatase (symmetrical)